MMNDHVTSEEMEALLMGPESSNRQAHLADCEPCKEELESLHATIADFRIGVTATAQQQYRAAAASTITQARPRMMWGLAAAAALICAAGPVVLHRVPNRAEVVALPQQQVQGAVSDSGSDAQLLSNVEDDLSASVPGPMLPLASANSSGTTNSMDASTNVAKENE